MDKEKAGPAVSEETKKLEASEKQLNPALKGAYKTLNVLWAPFDDKDRPMHASDWSKIILDISRKVPEHKTGKTLQTDAMLDKLELREKHLVEQKNELLSKLQDQAALMKLTPVEQAQLLAQIRAYIDVRQFYDQILNGGASDVALPEGLETSAAQNRNELQFLNKAPEDKVAPEESLRLALFPEINATDWADVMREIKRRPPAYPVRPGIPASQKEQYFEILEARADVLRFSEEALKRIGKPAEDELNQRTQLRRLIANYLEVRKEYDHTHKLPPTVKLTMPMLKLLRPSSIESLNQKIVLTILPTQYDVLEKQGVTNQFKGPKPKSFSNIAEQQLLDGSRQLLTLKTLAIDPKVEVISDASITLFLQKIDHPNVPEEINAAKLLLGYLAKRARRYQKDLTDIPLGQLCREAHATGAADFMRDFVSQMPGIAKGNMPKLREAYVKYRKASQEKKEDIEAAKERMRMALEGPLMAAAEQDGSKRGWAPLPPNRKRPEVWKEAMDHLLTYVAGQGGNRSCAGFLQEKAKADADKKLVLLPEENRSVPEMVDVVVSDACTDASVDRFMKILLLENPGGWTGRNKALKNDTEKILKEIFVTNKDVSIRDAVELYQMQHSKPGHVMEAMKILEIVGERDARLANKLESFLCNKIINVAENIRSPKVLEKLGLSQENQTELENLARYGADEGWESAGTWLEQLGDWYLDLLENNPKYGISIGALLLTAVGYKTAALSTRIKNQKWVEFNSLSVEELCKRFKIDMSDPNAVRFATEVQKASIADYQHWEARKKVSYLHPSRVGFVWAPTGFGKIPVLPYPKLAYAWPSAFRNRAAALRNGLSSKNWVDLTADMKASGIDMRTSIEIQRGMGVAGDDVIKNHQEAGYEVEKVREEVAAADRRGATGGADGERIRTLEDSVARLTRLVEQISVAQNPQERFRTAFETARIGRIAEFTINLGDGKKARCVIFADTMRVTGEGWSVTIGEDGKPIGTMRGAEQVPPDLQGRISEGMERVTTLGTVQADAEFGAKTRAEVPVTDTAAVVEELNKAGAEARAGRMAETVAKLDALDARPGETPQARRERLITAAERLIRDPQTVEELRAAIRTAPNELTPEQMRGILAKIEAIPDVRLGNNPLEARRVRQEMKAETLKRGIKVR